MQLVGLIEDLKTQLKSAGNYKKVLYTQDFDRQKTISKNMFPLGILDVGQVILVESGSPNLLTTAQELIFRSIYPVSPSGVYKDTLETREALLDAILSVLWGNKLTPAGEVNIQEVPQAELGERLDSGYYGFDVFFTLEVKGEV